MPSLQIGKWLRSHPHVTIFSNTKPHAGHHSGIQQAVTTSQPFLLTLPLEIREEIYQYFVQPSIIEDRKELEYFSEY